MKKGLRITLGLALLFSLNSCAWFIPVKPTIKEHSEIQEIQYGVIPQVIKFLETGDLEKSKDYAPREHEYYKEHGKGNIYRLTF